MGFDLGDSFNRLFNSGNYSDYKAGNDKGPQDSISRVGENFNPFGKSVNEWAMGGIHPLGLDNKGTAQKLDQGDIGGAWTNFNADNPMGRNTTFEKQRQGWDRGDAIKAGSDTTANTAASIIALIYGGGALAGGGAGGSAAGGSAAGSGAAAAGTGGEMAAWGAPATQSLTPTMGASGMGTGAGGLGVAEGSVGMGSVGLGSTPAASAGFDWGGLAKNAVKNVLSQDSSGGGAQQQQAIPLQTPTVEAAPRSTQQAIQAAYTPSAEERVQATARALGLKQ